MSRFNTAAAKVQPHSAVTSEAPPSGLTHEGAPGWKREAKSELFLLAVTHMGDGTFYETDAERGRRFTALIHQVAMTYPEWMRGFIPWLRDSAQMRTASVIAAAEAAKALLIDEQPGGRQLIASALKRADEPGELLAYWHSRYGRALPKPVKRGIGDAVQRLYSEYALLKYDTASHGYRFGDVLDLTHPSPDPGKPWQGDLFAYALDRRHNRDNAVPDSLTMVHRNEILRGMAQQNPAVLLNAEGLKNAGMTWEDALSLAGSRVSKRELWTALLPSLGFMAALRNLRNLDDAGVPDDVAATVAARFTDPEQVAKSRQFPFRFLAAYKAAPSLRWAYPLEKALNLSLSSVPALGGRTLILVDRSGSMFDGISARSGLNRADSAAIFGAALATRSEHADLVQFGTYSEPVQYRGADSVLKVVERFGSMGGTYTAQAVQRHFRPGFHSRVVIVTDEQAHYGAEPGSLIPPSVPLYTWNLAGYKYGHGASGGQGRHTFGGLSDSSFRMIPLLESGRDSAWPWMDA